MEEKRNPYGNIIRTERIKQGIGIDTLAARCMMSPLDIMDVESGNRWFSEAQLRLASAALDLSRDGLLRGERLERTKPEEIRQLLTEFYKDLSELTSLQERILKKISEISPWQRFTVDQIRKADSEVYEPVQYAIFDNDRGDYVRDESGGIVFFKSASEAFEEAQVMENAVRKGKDILPEHEERMERDREPAKDQTEHHLTGKDANEYDQEEHKEHHLTESKGSYEPYGEGVDLDKDDIEQNISVPRL